MSPSARIAAGEFHFYIPYPIMESVASKLKSAREQRKISLAQIAADTHISMRHLESLEEGRYGDLPGGIYNRAFLRAYCERLDLDQREMLQCYEAEVLPLAEKLPKSKVHIPPQNSPLTLNPVIIWSIVLLISAAGLFLSRNWISAVFSPYFRHSSARSDQFEPPKQQIVPPVPAVPSDSAQKTIPVPPTTQPTPSTTQVPAGTGSSPAPQTATPVLQLELVGTDKCWISLERDGIIALRKVIEPGEVQSFSATEKFHLKIGNAGGIRLKINGKPLKQLGQPGDVRQILIDEKTLPDLIDTTAG